MASLKAIQRKIPGADSVAGRVIAFHQGKHYDLGQYVGEGSVILSQDGERLMAQPAEKGPEVRPVEG